MSKKKLTIKDTEKPSFSEFIGRKLIDRAIHKKSKSTDSLAPHDHETHDHEHIHSYIAMVIDDEVKEVVSVGGAVKDILLAQPKMVLINESEYPTRPTIGWTYVDEKFIAPEEPK